MENLVNQLLSLVVAYGYPIIGLTVLVSSLGIPLPQNSIVLIAGSLAVIDNLNLFYLFVLITMCSVIGDCIDYFIGRKLGEIVFQKLNKRSSFIKVSHSVVQRYFRKWSGMSIFLSRWLFTPVSSIVSIFAGVAGYPFRKFIFFDISGQVLSSIIFLSLGYFFSANWPYIWEYLDTLPGIVTAIASGVILLIIGIRKFVNKK